jgi:hypothetical protein
MTSKTFISGTVIDSAWLNDVNTQTYGGTGGVIGTPFTQNGTGAAPRSLQDRGKDVVYVTDFYANGTSGAKVDPTGVIDSTAGIQAAINYVLLTLGRGTVFFPSGSYLLSATLVVANPAIANDTGYGQIILQGEGGGSTQLYRTTNYGDTIRFNNLVPNAPLVDSGIQGFVFYYDTNTLYTGMSTGAAINMQGCVRFFVKDCSEINHYDGFNIVGGSSILVEHCYSTKYNGVGGVNGVNNSGYKTSLGTGRTSSVPLPSKIVYLHCGHGGVPNQAGQYGYWITSGEQVELVACEASGALQNNLRIEQLADNSLILEVAVRGGYYDCCGSTSIYIGGTAGNGTSYIGDIQIHDVFVKASGFGNSYDGIYVDGTARGGTFSQVLNGLIISGCHILTFNRHGINLNGGGQVVIKGNIIRGNSYTTINNGDGIVVGAAVVQCLIDSNIIGYNFTGLASGNQQYGVLLTTGATGIVVSNNDLRGNATSPLLNGIASPTTSQSNYQIINNIGYNGNRAAASPTIPASTVNQYNPYGSPAWVSVFGGTVTHIALNGQDVSTTGPITFPVGPMDRVTLTYSVAPSWIWWPM